MNYTKEQYDKLTKYRDKLYTACYCKFVRMSSRADLIEMDEIYKEVFHTSSGAIGGCSRCLMTVCQKLGSLYFQDEKEYKSIEAEQAAKQAVTEEQPTKQTHKTANTNKKPKPKTNNKKK